MKTLILSFLFLLLASATGRSQGIAYGSINNFDTVNDTGHEAHGFEIEIEDCHSTNITYTYDYNHYSTPKITEDSTLDGRPRTKIRWESKKNADGSWASFTAIPSGPITPTNGHMFTNPSINFGGEHFGVGYSVPATKVRYNWLIDNGFGVLVNGGAVQVSTPTFTYYPGAVAEVQAVIAPPPPPAPEPKEFGKAIWLKEIRTTSHNNNEVKLRDLISDDPADPDDKNWRNGEPDEVETEWQILQTDYHRANADNNQKAALPEELPGGDEVVTRRYEFYKYVGPLDEETGEAKCQNVGPDGIHGVGEKEVNGVVVDLSTVEVVGEYTGAQMAALDVDAPVGLIDHVSEGVENEAYPDRTIVIEGAQPFTSTLEGGLPLGMNFNQVTGVLSGTPEVSGEFQFSITASDGVNPDVAKNYLLTIAAGGVDLPPASLLDTTVAPAGTGLTTGDGSFAPQTSVTVNATPLPGFHFVNWTDNGTVVSSDAQYTFVIDVNHSLTANFAVGTVQRNISASVSPAGGGTVSGGGIVDDGSEVTVFATPGAGYVLISWTVNDEVVSTTPSYTFTATADKALVANFAIGFNIAANSSFGPGGTVSGAGGYATGGEVTLIATPEIGYEFTGWSETGVNVGFEPSYTFPAIADRTLVAEFLPKVNLDDAVPGILTIAWPESAVGWSLEESGDLETSSWGPSPLPVSTEAGQSQVSILNPTGDRFFRLSRP